MKLKKRIAAMGAAMVMAVSMMSIGASAYTESFFLTRGSSSFSRNVTVSQRSQKMTLDEFTRVGNNTASATLYNNVSPALNKTWSSSDTSYSYTVSASALGTTVTIGAYLNSYTTASSVVASGSFSG